MISASGSAELLAWLSCKGVPFEGSLCPDKTSYPTNRHYLYYSGSERSFAQVATPAPRGHRAVGRGTSGRVLFGRLATAVGSAGIRVVLQTRADHLVTGEAGQVIGVECLSMRGAPGWARLAHRVLHKIGKKPFLYGGSTGRRLHQPVAWLERQYARPLLVRARNGVVITAGGFVANRALLREHAPAYRGGLALGTVGRRRQRHRSGRRRRRGDEVPRPGLLLAVHHAAGRRSCAALLVDRAGQRVCDESLYGAAIGEAMVRRADRRAWLLVDKTIVSESWRQLPGSTLWFQLLQAVYLLTRARVSGSDAGRGSGQGGRRRGRPGRYRRLPTTPRPRPVSRTRRASRPTWCGYSASRRSR